VACPALPFFFSKLSHKRHDFREDDTEHKSVLIVSATFAETFFFILRRIQREMIINVHRSSRICYFCRILMKLEFSPQIFEKYSNIKFQENPSSGSQVVPCG
jgi:hypothetical protein